MSKQNDFDLMEEYDEQVKPIVLQLHAKCEELQMPCAIFICARKIDGGDEIAASVLLNPVKGRSVGVLSLFSGLITGDLTPKEAAFTLMMQDGEISHNPTEEEES